MMCCELCGETTECVQREVNGETGGEICAICENCPIAERVSTHACVSETAGPIDEIDEFEETLI